MLILSEMPVGAILGIVFGFIFIVVAVILLSGIRIVRQTEQYVVERLGVFRAVWDVGVHYLWPFFYRIEIFIFLCAVNFRTAAQAVKLFIRRRTGRGGSPEDGAENADKK